MGFAFVLGKYIFTSYVLYFVNCTREGSRFSPIKNQHMKQFDINQLSLSCAQLTNNLTANLFQIFSFR